MLNDRIVVPAALALTQLRDFAERTTARRQHHLTAFQVLHGVTFTPAATVQLTLHATPTPEACRVSLHHDNRTCYQALAMHTTTPPPPTTRLQALTNIGDEDVTDIYTKILFHGQRLQLLQKVSAPSAQTSSAAVNVPDDSERETALLDAALQLAIVHIHRRYKAFSLPAAIGSYRLFNSTLPQPGTITVRLTARHNAHVLIDAEITHDTQLLARVDAIEMIVTKGKHTLAS